MSKQAFDKYKKHNTIQNQQQFINFRATARYIITRSKIVTRINFVSRINISMPPTEIWNRIRRISGTYSNFNINILTEGGQDLTSTQDIFDIVVNTFEQFSSNTNYHSKFLDYKHLTEKLNPIRTDSNNNSPLNTSISWDEFYKALKKVKDSSPGPDNIPTAFIKNLSNQASIF